MREIIAESQPFVRDELTADGRPRPSSPTTRYKLEIIDDASDGPDVGHRVGPRAHLREPAADAQGRARPSPATPASSTCAAAPTCPTTDGFLGHFKLMRIAGAYWKGDEREPPAPAHLRHGVGHEAGARGAPRAARGGRQARPPQARRRARPVQLPRRDRLAAWPCSTPRAASSAGSWRTTRRRAPRGRRLRVRLHAPHRQGGRCSRRSGHLDWYADGMFPPMHFDDEGGNGGQTTT